MSDDFGKLIFKYTREDALRDGVLIDITRLASECGFKLPTAINADLYNHFREERRDQDIERLLVEFYFRIAVSSNTSDLLRTRVDGEDVVLHIGGGDDGNPVLTLCYLIDL